MKLFIQNCFNLSANVVFVIRRGVVWIAASQYIEEMNWN